MPNPVLYDYVKNKLMPIIDDLRDASDVKLFNKTYLGLPTPQFFSAESFTNSKGFAHIWFGEGQFKATNSHNYNAIQGEINVYAFFKDEINATATDPEAIFLNMLYFQQQIINQINSRRDIIDAGYLEIAIVPVSYAMQDVFKNAGRPDLALEPPYYGVRIDLQYTLSSKMM